MTGDPAVFVSVSAAHQGPDGGGPVAAIVDLGATGEPTGTATHTSPPTACTLVGVSTGGACRGSVGEVAGAGEVHRDAGRLRRLDHLGVAHRPTRGDDRADAGVEQHLEPVGEREERVGCRDGSARPLLAGA